VIIRMDRTLISRRIVRRVVRSHRTLELWREFILLASLASYGRDFTRYACGIPSSHVKRCKMIGSFVQYPRFHCKLGALRGRLNLENAAPLEKRILQGL
jgi:hypothetical protein